jgi:phosphoheptose isomerase
MIYCKNVKKVTELGDILVTILTNKVSSNLVIKRIKGLI